MNIANQVALVTGANRGFGKALAQELLARGAKVYAGARNPASVDLPGAIPLQVDITDAASIAAAAAIAGDVTVLINNAGTLTGAALLDGEIADIRSEFETHVFGTLAMVRAFAPAIENNGGGAILNVLSALSWFSVGDIGAYSAAKSGAWGMTNALRLELAPKNIKLAALHVAYMDTDMASNVNAPKSSPAEVAKLAIDGIETGSYEILADETTRKLQAGLAGGVAALYPSLK